MPLPALHVLTLTGAYRLTDGALGRVLRAAPNLRELRLPQARLVLDMPALSCLCCTMTVLMSHKTDRCASCLCLRRSSETV